MVWYTSSKQGVTPFILKVDQLLSGGSIRRAYVLPHAKCFRDHSDARWQGSSMIGPDKVGTRGSGL